MFTLLRSLGLLASISWSAHVVRNASRWLDAYFRAQAVYTVALGILLLLKVEPWIYELVFTVATFAVIAAAAGFVWECFSEYDDVKWVLFIQSLVLPNVLVTGAYHGLMIGGRPVPSYIWISLGESAAMMTLGIILSPIAVMMKRRLRVPGIVLSVLWVLLGAYEYGFTLLYPSNQKLWDVLNEFVPAVLVTVAFLTIGWKQKSVSLERT